MKTTISWFALCVLATVGCWVGRLDVALLAAGIKATLVGLHFMELGEAARCHANAWVAWTSVAVGTLLLIT